ncbi:MAG TPA: prolyl oligopeptidase family serine peptidase [Candidatus Hydrogenedentes bacterium]|nr:prolyl oligopeptidase family serine peptidase [Candidatus Hydrogenedentota bacterium]
MVSRHPHDSSDQELLGKGGYPVELLHRPGAGLRVRPRDGGRYRRHMNLVYAEALGTGLIMDVFEPLSGPNGLGVIDVISSGWRCDRIVLQEHVGLGLVDALCGAGFTVFAVQLGDISQYSVESMAMHVRASIRHIKVHAARWGVNPERLGITGASAGAHLGLLAGMDPDTGRPDHPDPWRRVDTTVSAAVWFFPPVDLLDFKDGKPLIDVLPDGVELKLFARHLEHRQRADALLSYLEQISPWRKMLAAGHLNRPYCPMLFIHGTGDALVPWEHSRKMVQLLQERGGTARLLLREGGGHPWPDMAPELEEAVQWLYRWLSG